MSKEYYFIVREGPFLLLGRDKWLSSQELIEGQHAMYCFPDAAKAQTAQAMLPKAMKPGTKIRTSKFIEDTYNLKFLPKKGFIQAGALERGPDFEALFSNTALEAYVLPQKETYHPPQEINPDGESEAAEATGEPSLIHAAATSLSSGVCDGRDTTITNDSVTMFEDILNVLERGVCFRDHAQLTINDQLSVADREIMDELHFLEFNQLGAADGFRVYQRLRDLRLKRRGIKDSAIIATYLSDLLSGIDRETLADFWERLNALRSRKYRLRAPDSFAHPSDGQAIY